MRPCRSGRVLLRALAVALVVGSLLCGHPGSLAGEAAPAAAPVTVFVVRHAEKAADGADPGLSVEGQRRAEAVARLLVEAGVTELVATEYRRTQQTLAPLAEHLDLEIAVVGARSPEEVVRRIEALPPGAVAVVAGHSNTVPAMVRALGGSPRGVGEALDESDYSRIYQVIRPHGGHGAVQTIELRFEP